MSADQTLHVPGSPGSASRSEADPGGSGSAEEVGRRRYELRRLAELTGALGIAIAQPVLGIFGSDAGTFVQARAGRLDIVMFLLAVCLGPPVLAWAATAPLGRHRLRMWAHRALLAGSGGAVGVHAVRQLTEWGSVPALVVGGLVATIVFALMGRELPREWARWLSLAVPAFVAAFLFGPVGDLVWPSSAEAAIGDVPDDFDLVMVVLDEFPTASLLDGEGDIDRELFPSFGRLADRSTWYRNHTTVAPFTQGAVPALMSGLLPDPDAGAPTFENHPDTLLSWVANAGEVSAIESVTRLCPAEACANTEAAPGRVTLLRSLLFDAVEVWRKRTSPDPEATDTIEFAVEKFPTDTGAADKLDDFARGLGSQVGSTPRMDLAHVLLPHQPFVLNADGSRYRGHEPPRGAEFFIWSDERSTEVARLRHQLQLVHVDTLVGELLDAMDESGRSDSAALVVVADHGIGFTPEEPIRGVSPGNASEVAWVPLFISPPGAVGGEIADRPARSIDVAPTVAGLFDAELAWDTDGVDLADQGADSGPPAVLDWNFNENVEVGENGFVAIDGRAGLERLLEFEPVGGEVGAERRQFLIGPRPELVGTEVSSFEAAPPLEFAFTWEFPEGPVVEVGEGSTPTYVSIRLEGAPEGDLAISIDGVIGAVAPWNVGPFGVSDAWAILPTDLFGASDQAEIGLHLVTGSKAAPVLAEVEPT